VDAEVKAAQEKLERQRALLDKDDQYAAKYRAAAAAEQRRLNAQREAGLLPFPRAGGGLVDAIRKEAPKTYRQMRPLLEGEPDGNK
jgi:hypothetical protein